MPPMGDILWGNRFPGDETAVGTSALGAHTVVGAPQWVRTPAELGSQQFRVGSVYWRDCPCGEHHMVKTFTLRATDLQVSECVRRGFLWWRPSA